MSTGAAARAAVAARDLEGARAALREIARATLEATRRTTESGGLETVPSPATYGAQSWKWDLAFGGLVAARCGDDALARGSLESALRNQVREGPDAGLVPHMNFNGGDDEELWRHPRRSCLTQPPVVSLCARAIDEGFARTLAPALEAELEWWLRARLDRPLEEGGLPVVIHPWETGRDAARDHDRSLAALAAERPASLALETHNPDAPKDEASKRARFALLEHIQRDPRAARAIYQLRCPDMVALVARTALDLGRDEVAAQLRANLQARLFRDGFLFSEDNAGLTAPRCGSAFVALAAGPLDDEVEGALLEALASDAFWSPFPVPTVARDDEGYRPELYWRGSTWLPTNLLILDGLARCRRPEATELRRELAWRSADLVARSGTREFYDAETGVGYGPAPFTWSGLGLVALDYT